MCMLCLVVLCVSHSIRVWSLALFNTKENKFTFDFYMILIPFNYPKCIPISGRCSYIRYCMVNDLIPFTVVGKINNTNSCAMENQIRACWFRRADLPGKCIIHMINTNSLYMQSMSI